MNISDLSYLESTENNVIGGSGSRYHGRNYSVRERIDVRKRVSSKIHLKGNLATGDSQAYGDNTLSEVIVSSNPYGSDSFGLAATD